MLIEIIALILLFNSTSSESERIEGRIVRGDTGSIEDYPYSAFLLMGKVKGSFVCGAAIVNQRILLTAAHCVDVCKSRCINSAAFIGSEHKRNGLKIPISAAQHHKKYNTKRVHYDIGLALLAKPLKFGKLVKRVAIYRSPRINGAADIAGWGLIDEVKKIHTPYLHHITQKIIKYDECKTHISNLPQGCFCGGGIKKEQYASEGDSGSALIINKYIQIGLVSYKRPDISLSLVVYTNVSYYYDWIRETSRQLYCQYI